MFIDDDIIFNHIHKVLAEKTSFAKNIYMHTSATSGLQMLQDLESKNNELLPQVIFLDLMMPVMDGFDFLNEFEKLHQNISQKIKVVILTSSLNAEDRFRAMKHHCVAEYISKPLTINSIMAIKNKLIGV